MTQPARAAPIAPTAVNHRLRHGVSRLLCTAALLLGLSACSGTLMDTPAGQQAAAIKFGASLPPAQPPQGLAFSVLKTSASKGTFEALVVSGGSWWRFRHPVHAAVLVQHPQGSFLFDTGLGRQVGPQFAANTWLDKQFFGYGPVTPVAEQLARAGWAPDRLKMIVPSHLHWDHVSALPDFPGVPVWASPAERQQARQGHAPAFLASQFAGVQQWHDLVFQAAPYLGFATSLDVFGDGAVVLVPLGGHTAGQVGMFLNLPSGQRYFFTGDVSWTIEGLQRAQDRAWLLRQVLHVDYDEPANQRAIVHIHQLMQRFPQIKVVPAHDEHVFDTLPHFPQFQG
jgi:glyoxylase-like metal-dependent hydrolase (beta-lactamase superfamily II)